MQQSATTSIYAVTMMVLLVVGVLVLEDKGLLLR